MPPNRLTVSAVLLSLPLLLSGCVTPRALVKDVLADREGYLAREYSQDKLKPEVVKALAAGGAAPSFKRITMKVKVTYKKSGQEDSPYRFESTVINAGNGLIQEMREASNNDIPYGLQYDLSYAGLVALKAETVLYNLPRTLPASQAQEVHEFSPGLGRPAENQSYAFEYSLGTPEQTANLDRRRTECRSGTYYPASTLNTAFTGQALDLECELKKDGRVTAKRKVIFLRDLGVYLKAGTTTSVSREIYEFEQVTVR